MAEGVSASLRILGRVELYLAGRPVPLSELERGLLAVAAFRGQIGADELADWLWGETPPASARNRVQGLVSGVRRKAGAPVLLTEGRAYRLACAVEVDHDGWREAVARGRSLREVDPAGSIAAYDRAIALFGERPLDGAPNTPRADFERDRLEQERLQILEERLATRIDSGRLEGAVAEAAALARQRPFHEGFLALYVLALAGSGQQRQALEVYREARRRLADELGIEPSTQLREAHQRVLQGDVPAASRQAPITAQPELAESGSAEPSRAATVLPVPQMLPRPPAGFVGRGAQLNRIAAAAEDATARAVAVSITGLTGVGKSALAVEAGGLVRGSFPDGPLYADLSGTSDGDLGAVLGNFLRLLGVLQDAIPDDFGARVGMFRSLVDGRRLLVVLDNVDAQGAPDPRLADLLPASPGTMSLITSRGPLMRVEPTVRVRLQGLPAEDAVELLRQVAGPDRIESDPDAALGLVQHTGGLPLALRLVAGRLAQRPDLSIRSLARRLADTARGLGVLDDAPEGTLRASLTMVWNRLPEETTRVARLLTLVPADAFSAWVPHALLCDAGAGERAMNSLIDASFVEPVLRPGRSPQYRLHDIVVRFARELPPIAPEDAGAALTAVARTLVDRLGQCHTAFPLQFLPMPPLEDGRPVGEQLDGLDVTEAQELVLTELALARGCARALAGEDPALAWRLLAACENGHRMSSEHQAWATAIDAVAASLDPVRDDDRLGAAMLTLCRAWYLQDALGQYGQALTLATQARRELTLLGAVRPSMAAGLVAAYAALALSDRDTAEEELGRVADAGLRTEDPVLTGWRHIVQGELYNDYDELEECERELARARHVLAGTGERIGYAYATAYLSRALRRQGNLGPARILADEALADFARFGAEHAYTVALDGRAEVGVELGHGDEALAQATTALARAVASRDAFLTARATRTRGRALRVLGGLAEAAAELRSSVEQFAAINRTLSVAATLHDLALVQDLMGEPAAADETFRQERAALVQARNERAEAMSAQGATRARRVP